MSKYDMSDMSLQNLICRCQLYLIYNNLQQSTTTTLKVAFIELDYGKIYTGKPNQFHGKIVKSMVSGEDFPQQTNPVMHGSPPPQLLLHIYAGRSPCLHRSLGLNGSGVRILAVQYVDPVLSSQENVQNICIYMYIYYIILTLYIYIYYYI